MPNTVCNHLIIHGKKAVEIMRTVLKESDETDCGYEIDFEKIKSMPQELCLPHFALVKECARLYVNSIEKDKVIFNKYADIFGRAYDGDYYVLAAYERPFVMQEILNYTRKDFFKNESEVYACGKQALDNYEKYGVIHDTDWRERNWGTSSEACNTQVNNFDKADIYFETESLPVPPLIQALSEKYPDCKFEYEYAENRAGGYAGFYNYENGIAVSFENYPEDSKDAYEMYFALWGQEDEYKFNPQKGTYEYIDGETM